MLYEEDIETITSLLREDHEYEVAEQLEDKIQDLGTWLVTSWKDSMFRKIVINIEPVAERTSLMIIDIGIKKVYSAKGVMIRNYIEE